MFFGRKKKPQPERPATIKDALAHEQSDASAAAQVDITEGPADGEEPDTVQAPTTQVTADPAPHQANAVTIEGHPRDASEVESTKGYLDFGAILVPASKDQKVRLDIDQKSKRVVSLTIAVESSSIQLQAFSAPKSGGTWDEVRGQIEQSVVKQKGRIKQVQGPFGTELHARVPTVLKDGRQGWRAARFIGFDGGRWFLRGVIGGRGAIDRGAAAGVEQLFSQLLVSRGDEPLPPRELLKLQPPAGAKRVVVPGQGTPRSGGATGGAAAARNHTAGPNQASGPNQAGAQKPDA